MKLVTFNIRCDFGQDGENCFCRRRISIIAKIRREQPDIICFQEVLPHVAVWLKENLKGYYVIGCGRDENLEDEQVSVAYRRDRVNRSPWIRSGCRMSLMCREAATRARASARESVPGLCFRIAGGRERHICSGCIISIWTIWAGRPEGWGWSLS